MHISYYTGWRKKNACFSNNCDFVCFQYKKITLTPKQPVINAVLITYIDYSITENYRVAQKERTAFRRCNLATTFIRFIYLRFLSLGLPQIKSLHSKTSYSRRAESSRSRRNCNCATRNVSKCDAELWGEAPDSVRREGRHLSDIIFRNWLINVSNQNCIYYRLFWC